MPFTYYLKEVKPVFFSPGGHYSWKLWARWARQEPQRDRYRWVAPLFLSSIHHLSIHLSLTYSSSATQRVFLNLPRDTFQIPPHGFDPPKWPPGIIPSAGLRERCQEDESLRLHQDDPGPIRPGEMINASASGSSGLVGADWSVSRGVEGFDEIGRWNLLLIVVVRCTTQCSASCMLWRLYLKHLKLLWIIFVCVRLD